MSREEDIGANFGIQKGDPTFGGFDLSDVGDAVSDAADAVADVATSAVDRIGDAGHEIGAVLQSLAPIISMIPGYGTVIGAAFYAAGAIAAKQPIDAALIGTTSMVIPAGVPRISFDGAASVAEDMAHGRNAFGSVIDTCRRFAAQSGPQAEAAFNAGLAVGRGQKIDQAALAAGHAYAVSQGPGAVAAFDVGAGIAQNEGADQVLIAIGHDYAAAMGGPLAAGAFDTGIALGMGKTLQEAGYSGLRAFIAGNDGAERVYKFVEACSRAHNLAEVVGATGDALADTGALQLAVTKILTSDLAEELKGKLTSAGGVIDSETLRHKVEPYVRAIAADPEWLQESAAAMVTDQAEEIFARTAMALMRGRTGHVDEATFQTIMSHVGEDDTEGSNDSARTANNDLVSQSVAILAGDGMARLRRSKEPDVRWRRGYDIGTSVSYGKSASGPGQDAIRATLAGSVTKTRGFDAARAYQYGRGVVSVTGPIRPDFSDRTPLQQRLHDLQVRGGQMAAADPTLAVVRAGTFAWLMGFDVAIATCAGTTDSGQGQAAVRADVVTDLIAIDPIYGPDGGTGFDVGQAMQHGISKMRLAAAVPAGDPRFAAGQIAIHGIAGSSLSQDQKAMIASTIAASSVAARAGAATTLVALHRGPFRRLWDFLFGGF